MEPDPRQTGSGRGFPHRLARVILVAFLGTFIAVRILVFLIMSRRIPDLYLHVGGTHLHHLNLGIFLLSAVGAILLFQRPEGRALRVLAALYGIGMALTFDEFGMWLHLGGSYWQRASWDAVTVLTAALALLAFAPSLRRLRPRHVITTLLLLVAMVVFFILMAQSFRYVGKTLGPRIHRIEGTSPQ
ncbi:MAG: hypothetical protein KBE04_09605 [Phycisphaerae bacterium]|nr:hypothetical protein [Phycisphaerae bacterium]